MPGPFGGQSQQRWGDNTVNANEYLRDIMLTDLTGRPTSTSDARRKGMLVLAFFRPSDPASQAVLPCLQALADAYKDSGKLTVLGISEEDRTATKAAADTYGLKFPLMLDHDLYHAMVYGLAAIPTVFLADGTGLVVRKTTGFRPDILNDMSAKIAAFAGVEAVPIATENAKS